jgi:hypothetical protein
MFNRILCGAVACVTVAFLIGSPLAAGAPSSQCIAAVNPKGGILAADGKWIALTPKQFQFMRGVYVLNPNTPPGLPFGESAVLASVPGDKGGVIFFIDGDKACTPMPIPPALIEMLFKLDDVTHEGGGT